MGLIVSSGGRVPPGHYDITDYAGLNTITKYDGTDDVTASFQSCINYCVANSYSLILPKSTKFKISDTLYWLDDGTISSWTDYITQHRRVLIGQQGGIKPQIILSQGATGFQTNTDGKPVLHILYSLNAVTYPPASESASWLYKSVLSNIDIDCGNNPGAAGVLFDGAQECFMEHISVYGSNFMSGFIGIPGRCMCSRNLSVTGTFKYGLYLRNTLYTAAASTSLAAMVCGLRINGCTDVAVYNSTSRGGISIIGFDIKIVSGKAFQGLGYRNGEYGNFSLYDGLIECPTNSIAIDAQYTTVCMQRVWVKNALTICDHYSTARDYAGNGTGWFYIERYKGGHSKADGNTVGDNGSLGMDKFFVSTDGNINNIHLVSSANMQVDVSNVPTGDTLCGRHYYYLPDITSTNIIYATDTTTTAACYNNNSTDNTTRIQDKINEAATLNKPLFFPPGIYKVSQKITLPANVTVFGSYGSRTCFSATTTWSNAVQAAGVETQYVDTVDDINGTTIFSNIVLDCIIANYAAAVNYTWLGQMKWSLGRKSICSEIWGLMSAGGRFDRPIYMTRIEGPTAGGRFWNVLSGASVVNDPDAFTNFNLNYRPWAVINTTEPIIIYGFDVEYGGASDRIKVHAPLALFDNAKNVLVTSVKGEAYGDYIEVRNNSNIIIGNLAVIAGTDNLTADILGKCVTLDVSSSLETHNIAAVAYYAGIGWLPGYNTVDIIEGTSVKRNQVIGGYERGTLIPVNTWDLDESPYVPPVLSIGNVVSTPVDNSANAGTSFSITPPVADAGDCVVLIYSHRGTGTPAGVPTLTITNTSNQTWTLVGECARLNNSAVRTWFCKFDGTWNGNIQVSSNNTGGAVLICFSIKPTTNISNWGSSNHDSYQLVPTAVSPYTYSMTGFTPSNKRSISFLIGQCSYSARTFTVSSGNFINLLSSPQIRCTSTSTQSVVAFYLIGDSATGDEVLLSDGANNMAVQKFSIYETYNASYPYTFWWH